MKGIQYRYVYVAAGVLGILGGYLYWYYWGCTESCPITSSWKLMGLRGGIIGLCLAAMFHPSKPKSTENATPS